MESSPPLVVSRRFAAAPETVFDAWLNAESAAQWLFATPGGVMEKVSIDPRVGGGFEIIERRGDVLAAHFGAYVEIDRCRRLAFDFSPGKDLSATRVSIEFESRDGACFITLTHLGVWPEYQERTRAGWAGILDGLARALGVE